MKKTIFILAIITLSCQSILPPPIKYSSISFVDDTGTFINNPLLHEMYDATHNLSHYQTDTSPNKQKQINTLFLQLQAKDKNLCRKLLNGEISACDTTTNSNHTLTPFIPLIDTTLIK